MNTRTKLATPAILSIGLVTALSISTATSIVTPAFAKKKHCDKIDTGCDTKTAKNHQNLLNGNNSSKQSDLGQSDSKIVHKESDLNGSQTEVENSTSSTSSESGNPFVLAGM